MSKEKVPNYSDAVTKQMVEIYVSAGVERTSEGDLLRKIAMDEIQVLTGKTLNSIRAKLGSEGVYLSLIKPEPKGKGVSKAELVAKIQDNEPSKSSGFFDSLEGANKAVLNFVLTLQEIAQGYAVEFDELENVPELDDAETPTS